MGGPTELDRDSDSPYGELLNRLKFGAEGAVFAGAISGAGAGISKLRNSAGKGKAIGGGKLDQFFELISGGLRARGDKNINQFLQKTKKDYT